MSTNNNVNEKAENVNTENTASSAFDTEEVKAEVVVNAEEIAAEQAEEAKELTPEEKIAELEAKISELQTAMLYKVAEFDNYRKRTIKEKADLILNGGKKVLEAMLPVVDDLERAEENIEKSDDVQALKEGLALVFQKFKKVLEGQGLKKMEVVGEDFCTDFHEAIAFVPGEDKNKGKVIDCVQNGYKLNEQVIRYAKVAVGQ